MTNRSALLAATALSALPFMAHAGDIKFSPVPFAADDASKREVIATGGVTVNGQETPLAYHVIARSGDEIGGTTFAALVDKDGNVVTSPDGSEHISADADFTSLLPVGDKLYSVTHFESRPGAMYLSELQVDADGNLTPVSTKPIDYSAYGGLWVPCAGSVTPWNTHLGSEEYPSDARGIEEAVSLDDVDDYDFPMVRYMGLEPETMTLDQFRDAYKPYRYGYPTEITVTEDGNGTAAKHFSMGRVAVELAKVMPDQRTAYISDDGTNVGMFRFVADNPGDLSAGTLYAAKWNQTSDEGAGAANLDWVDLGHADDLSVQKLIEDGTQFSDIFETAEIGTDGSCADGFMPSNAEARAECLKVKPGMELAASRLETRRYASMMGATTEFRKMEGIAYSPDSKSLFVAMSEVGKAMEAESKGDLGGRDDIRLAGNSCGAVYELALDDGYAAKTMKALVEGKPVSEATKTAAADPSCDPSHSLCGAAAEANTCDIDGIANPDNITFIPGYDTLVIGEDTGDGHQNDAVWAYNMSDASLTRIMSTPYGSETTSVYWYPNVMGHGYLMAVVQHPYGESDEDKLSDAADARAYIGYIGPFPALSN